MAIYISAKPFEKWQNQLIIIEMSRDLFVHGGGEENWEALGKSSSLIEKFSDASHVLTTSVSTVISNFFFCAPYYLCLGASGKCI